MRSRGGGVGARFFACVRIAALAGIVTVLELVLRYLRGVASEQGVSARPPRPERSKRMLPKTCGGPLPGLRAAKKKLFPLI